MKKEKYCYDCDNSFTIKSQTTDEVRFCPFCGSELGEDENIGEDDFTELTE